LNPVFAFGLTEAQWFGVLMIFVGLWQLVRAPRHVKVSTA
jgi:hypothetical protein